MKEHLYEYESEIVPVICNAIPLMELLTNHLWYQ